MSEVGGNRMVGAMAVRTFPLAGQLGMALGQDGCGGYHKLFKVLA